MAYKPKSEASRQYAEKLKDPRWRARREEILQRDSYTCRGCGAKDPDPPEPEEDGYIPEDIDPPEPVRLEVHHKYYEWGKDPWDYQNHALITLCEYCHDQETAYLEEATQQLIQAVRGRFLSKDIYKLAHAVRCLQMPFTENKEAARLIAWALTEPGVMNALQRHYENRNRDPKITSDIMDKMSYPLMEWARG